MTLDDDFDALYGARPEDFTALRKELSAAARKRGDRDGSTSLASARRPTTAAWVVNVLVRTDPTARTRLSELTAELRAAHAAMDGARIRALSTTQRALVAELVRAAFAAAGLSDPSAALRDDVTDTLQAAIADPEVAAKLGRLEKAEQWSGFGDFGATSASEAVAPVSRESAPKPAETAGVARAAVREAQRRRTAAQSDVDAARAAHDRAGDAVADRRAGVVAARRRYEKLLESLSSAEQEVESAEADLEDANRAERDASERLETANAALVKADSDLDELRDGSPS